MNWKSGLFRLWIALSVCWIALVIRHGYVKIFVPRQEAVLQQACFHARSLDRKLGNPFDCFDNEAMFADLIPIQPQILIHLVGRPQLCLWGLSSFGSWSIGSQLDSDNQGSNSESTALFALCR